MTPCREWEGRLDSWGYGRTYFRGGPFLAHRKAWIEANGEIPDGLMVLHHCDNPKCCEVSHLYLGTHADNMRDMNERGHNVNANKTHCKNGHEFTDENTGLYGGKRVCRACNRAAVARYKAKAGES